MDSRGSQKTYYPKLGVSYSPPVMNSQSLSALVITKNEEARLEDCLKGIRWADEIIVVDAESVDRTQDIARRYTDHVFIKPWSGFGAQKNFGIDQAVSAWIFIVDADERLSAELIEEIHNVVEGWEEGDPVAFRIPRRNIYYGEWVRWGGAYPDFQIRLFQNGKARYNNVEIHENLIIDGNVGTLHGQLDHYTQLKISDHFKKFSLYTTLAAKEKSKSEYSTAWWNILLNPLVVFGKKYVLKKGFQDGVRGLIFACFASMYTFVKYAKLWEMKQVQAIRQEPEKRKVSG